MSTERTAARPDVLVVGGGIGGLRAAFALRRKGLARAACCEQAARVRRGRRRPADRPELHPDPRRVRPARRGQVARRARRDHGHEGRRRRHRADPPRPGRPRAHATASRTWSSTAATCTASFLRACQRAGVDLVTDVSGRRLRARSDAGRRGRPSSDGPRRRRPRSSSPPTGCTRSPAGCSSTTSRSTRPTSPTAARCRSSRSRENEVSRERRRRLRRAAAATSCSTRCAAARCSTRSRSSSRPRRCAGEEDWGTPDELDAAFARHLRAGPAGPAAHVARQVVADVRPRPDHELGQRPGRSARRRRPPAAAVHGPGRDHGDRGRLGAGRARRPRSWPAALRSPTGRRLGRRAGGVRRRAARALPPRAHHRPGLGRAVAPRRR